MLIGLVEAELILVRDGPYQGQVGGFRAHPGREATQQRRHGACLAVQREAEGLLGQHPSLVPVAGP